MPGASVSSEASASSVSSSGRPTQGAASSRSNGSRGPTRAAAAAERDDAADAKVPMPQCFVGLAAAPSGLPDTGRRRKLLAYGDSLTAGCFRQADGEPGFAPYGRYLADALAAAGIEAEVWVCGLTGLPAEKMAKGLPAKRIRDGVGRLGQGIQHILRDQDGDFDLALIMAGTNDLSNRSSTANIATWVKSLHTACHEFGVPTVMLSVPPSDLVADVPGRSDAVKERFAKHRSRWCQANTLLQTWAKGLGASEGTALYVDTAQLIPYAENSPLWEEDGLHFTSEGSKTLGERLASLVEPLLRRPPPRPPRGCGRGRPRRRAPMPEIVELPATMTSSPSRPRKRLLAYGDSLTAGYNCYGHLFAPYAEGLVPALAGELELEVHVCGLSSLTAEEMAAAMDHEKVVDGLDRVGKGLRRMLRDDGPFDLALIMAGTNDLADEPEPDDILECLAVLHKACHAQGVPSVAVSIPPSRCSTGSGPLAALRKECNQLLKQWVQSVTGGAARRGRPSVLAFISADELMPFDTESGDWEADNLHFSRTGCLHFGQCLAPRLLPLLSAVGADANGGMDAAA